MQPTKYVPGTKVRLVGPLQLLDHERGSKPGDILTIDSVDSTGFWCDSVLDYPYFLFDECDTVLVEEVA